jgi:hypothetical protein
MGLQGPGSGDRTLPRLAPQLAYTVYLLTCIYLEYTLCISLVLEYLIPSVYLQGSIYLFYILVLFLLEEYKYIYLYIYIYIYIFILK